MSAIHLRFLTGPRRGQQLTLTGERIRIGRSRDNDVVLPDDSGTPASSARHAELIRAGRSWTIRDAGSSNGTFVNGVRVSEARLRSGDQIGLGGPALLECRLARSSGVWWVAASLLLVAGALALWAARRSPADFGPAADRVAGALFLVAAERDGQRAALGTAFALSDRGELATNAHVARELERRVASGARGLAIPTDASGEGWPVTAVRVHPDYEPGGLRYDVAVLQVDGGPLRPLRLAQRDDLGRLKRGMRVAAFGFPAPATDPRRPRARLSEDVLGDVRDGRLLEVGLRIAPGMSGSPIFTRDAMVIGLVVGGDFVGAGPRGRVSSGVNWGVSVAPLLELLSAGGSSTPGSSR
jgi:FHA domain/Trypsin-like peptidase domain